MCRNVTVTSVIGAFAILSARRSFRIDARPRLPFPWFLFICFSLFTFSRPAPGVSSDLLAIRRRRDSHRLPILGHRAARDIDLLGAQHLGDRLIRERALRSL